MKISISTYCYGSYVQRIGVLGVIDLIISSGCSGIEFAEAAWLPMSVSEMQKYGKYVASYNMEVPALCANADFINGSAGNIQAETDRAMRLVDCAAALGAKALRLDVVSPPRGQKCGIGYDDCIPRIVEPIRKVADYAEQAGIVTMTENHGYFSQDALRLEKLMSGVNHPNFGVLADIANFMCADEYPPDSVALLAPYIRHVHVKDFFLKNGMAFDPGSGWMRSRGGDYLRGTIVGHGDAGIYQAIQNLRRNGYDGYYSIEHLGLEEPLLGIQLCVQNLKKMLQA